MLYAVRNGILSRKFRIVVDCTGPDQEGKD